MQGWKRGRNCGVQMIALLALNDEGAPMFDQKLAAASAALGIPAFACTPDLFPDLMAAAIQRQDINRWVATQGIRARTVEGVPLIEADIRFSIEYKIDP